MKLFFDLRETYYQLCPDYFGQFKEKGHEVVSLSTSKEMLEQMGKDKLYELFANSEIASVSMVPVTKELMDHAPNLKLICTFGSAFNNIDIKTAGERGIPVVNGRGGGAISVAELSISMMMALSRNLGHYDHEMRQGIWQPRLGCELHGKTVGIVGVGAIGGEIARTLKLGFSMNVLAYDVVENRDLVEHYGVKYVDLETLFSQADYITVHAPLMPATRGMIHRDLFARMKPTAFFINASRGPVVVEEDLYQALRDGVIAGAGLDVFDPEPPNPNRFAELHNVIMSPHTGSNTPETARRISEILTGVIEDVIAGRKPRCNIVNKEFLAGPGWE